MATILITIIIAVITSKTLKRKKVDDELSHTVVKLVIVAGIFIGLFVPISGYEEAIKVREITPIQYENGKFFKTQKCKIYYQYEDTLKVARAGEENVVIEDTIKTSSAKVIKVDESEGKIIIYRAKAKTSIWTFGLSFKKTYEIYDPLTYQQ